MVGIGENETLRSPESWTVPQTLRQTIAKTKVSWARSKTIVIPDAVVARPPAPGGLRIAFLVYRGNPQCGGQGVYTRHLTRELVRLGHSVEVFSGAPWPELAEGVGFTPVSGLDLYRDPDPFRWPARREFHDLADVGEFGIMLSGGFGEPWAFARRVQLLLASRRADFDIIHDNQCLGQGVLALHREGWPLLETLHHPITVDRSIALDHATTFWQRYSTRRWFGFLRMQVRVVRHLSAVLTVSHNSKSDIHAQMGVALERLTVVPVGVDHNIFRPYDDVVKKLGRLMVTTSSDVPMKGLVPLLEALAKLRTERDIELVVIGRPKPEGRVAATIERLGLGDIVTTISGVSDEELARLYGEAQVAIVPSLYEGFSLPAIEAMSCAVPVVATTGGALPEVVGMSGETGLLVEPNNPDALVGAIRTLLDDPEMRARLGANARARVMSRFTWEVTAHGTVECYKSIMEGRALPDSVDFS
ncbi:MAG: glycosyltransferase family 4 protein [Acidimicrobiaceae bacterium]|nr:glycosyltransferase family 4 protein [Acidimicrobiaceae bacterium]